MTVLAWDRFGVELGPILDEVRPVAGLRGFNWDGSDSRGDVVPSGDIIVRLLADDAIASSTIRFRGRLAAGSLSAAGLSVVANRERSLAQLVRDAAQESPSIAWLRDALQLAIQLELSTLPPYLIARWTIKEPNTPVERSIRVVTREEMSHLGLACNLLVAIGGTPLIADERVVPRYPTKLPGNVRVSPLQAA